MKASKLQEKLLLLKLRQRDPDAFAKVYDLYVDPIYRFIYFKVPRRQDAEDLTSEAFLKVWQYLTETEETVRNLRALIYRCAQNLVVDFYRSKTREELMEEEGQLAKVEDARQQNFLAQLDAKTAIESLEPVLRRIKDEYREVLMLRYIEELSISEIADILEKSKGSVRVLIHRAIKVVRELSTSNARNERPADHQ